MQTRKRFICVATCLCGLLLGSGSARAVDLCGDIGATVPLFENSQLVCDVRCHTQTTPCVQFMVSGIKLAFNGHTMTGPAEPPAACGSGGGLADGISSRGLTDIVIEGPGLIQKFNRHGILLFQNTKATVKKLTSHLNCFSGLQVSGTTDSLVEEFVSVRNASASGVLPCGGICISGSHNNRIRRSEFTGNGSVAPGDPFGLPNDFGVGLTGASRGNVIEENGIGGNVIGIQVWPTAADNTIRKNVVAGNPQVQLGSPPVGDDIRDYSPRGANRFEENLCITYNGPPLPVGAQPRPEEENACPNIPQWAGHQNN